jgi:hypothetical protein
VDGAEFEQVDTEILAENGITRSADLHYFCSILADPNLKVRFFLKSSVWCIGVREGINFAKRQEKTQPGDRRGSRGTERTGSTVLCRRPLHRRPAAARIGRESLARSVAGNHTDGESHRTYGLPNLVSLPSRAVRCLRGWRRGSSCRCRFGPRNLTI